jgi:hypothetical protein
VSVREVRGGVAWLSSEIEREIGLVKQLSRLDDNSNIGP